MGGLKIGVIMDPIENIDINKDTSFVLMLEAQRRRHELYYMELRNLSTRAETPEGLCRPIRVRRANPHYRLDPGVSKPLEWFDVVLMRKDPPFDMNYFFATQLLGLVDEKKCLVMNRPAGLREANEKLYALHFPSLIPPTLVSCDLAQLKRFMDEQGGEMIIKPLDGCGGSGIFHLHKKDRNTNALLEAATANGQKTIMAQRYIAAVRKGDKRILVLNGEPLGALLRIPREDETRSNLHVGGKAAKTAVTARDRRICRVLAPSLEKLGLYFVGLDVIGGYLTEINVTSPTGVQEINSLNHVALEVEIIDFIERKVSKLQRP